MFIDVEGWIKARILEVMEFLGYEWPLTNEFALEGLGQQWSGLSGTLEGQAGWLQGGVDHVQAANVGPTASAFTSYVSSEDSSLSAVRNLAEAGPRLAAGFTAAAATVAAVRVACLAEILMDLVGLAAAILSGGLAAAGSFLLKQGAGAAIDWIMGQAIMELLGV